MQYKFYIDLADGVGGAENYVEIIPKAIEPFKITRERDLYFYRIEFGKITIADDPELHQISEEAKYAIFLTLQSQYYTKEIRVKVVTDIGLTVYGYFGHSDCTFDYDRKIVEVTPTVLDKYTNLMENWDTEIDFNGYQGDTEELTFRLEYTSLEYEKLFPLLIEGSSPERYKDLMTLIKNPVLEEAAEDKWGVFTPGAVGRAIDGAWGIFVYFEDDGTPVWNTIDSNAEFKFDINGETLSSKIQEMATQGTELMDQEDGDWEVCGIKIYYGEYANKSIFNTNWRRVYLEAEFAREEKITSVEDGANVSPGATWNYRGYKDGRPFYTRKPFDGDYSTSWGFAKEELYQNLFFEYNTQTGGYLPFYITQTGTKYYASLESRLQYPIPDKDLTITRSIDLRNFFEYILQNTHEDYASSNVYSTFLWNDDESDMSYYENKNTGMNYVSGKDNFLNNIKVFFKKDLKTNTDEDDNEVGINPKTRDYLALTTFRESFENFNGLFRNQLFWWLDDNLDMHIEHIKYVDTKLKYEEYYDLMEDDVQAPLLAFTQKWNYDKSIHWAKIEINVIDAIYVDFTENTVEWPKIVSNKRIKDKKNTISIQYFTTDLRFAIENPNSMEDGVVLVAVDDDNNVRNIMGRLSGRIETNGYLALSHLLNEFGRYEGVYVEGFINEETAEFETTSRSKLGIELTLKGTMPYLFYGTQFGAGLIDDGTIDIEKGYTKIKLRYKYISDALSDQWVLVVQKEDDFEGAENIWHDIDNYEI
jgi:hypothetical protein